MSDFIAKRNNGLHFFTKMCHKKSSNYWKALSLLIWNQTKAAKLQLKYKDITQKYERYFKYCNSFNWKKWIRKCHECHILVIFVLFCSCYTTFLSASRKRNRNDKMTSLTKIVNRKSLSSCLCEVFLSYWIRELYNQKNLIL